MGKAGFAVFIRGFDRFVSCFSPSVNRRKTLTIKIKRSSENPLRSFSDDLFHSSRRLIKQFPLRLLFGNAHVGLAVGKSDVQFLPLLQNIGVADDLSACVFDDGEPSFQNLLRRYGFEQGGLGGQALAAVDKQLAEGVRQGRLKAVDVLPVNGNIRAAMFQGLGLAFETGGVGADVLRHRVGQGLRQFADVGALFAEFLARVADLPRKPVEFLAGIEIALFQNGFQTALRLGKAV